MISCRGHGVPHPLQKIFFAPDFLLTLTLSYGCTDTNALLNCVERALKAGGNEDELGRILFMAEPDKMARQTLNLCRNVPLHVAAYQSGAISLERLFEVPLFAVSEPLQSGLKSLKRYQPDSILGP